MRKIYFLFFLQLFIYYNSQEQTRTFLRLYNISGNKFQKGHFAGSTDSSIYIHKDSGKMEISVLKIGYIKTRRSLGHNILLSATPAAVGFGVLGLATGEARETTDNDVTLPGVLHDLTTFTPEEGLAAGLILGGLAGTATGSLITVLTKRTTFSIGGDIATWQSQKKIIDLLPSGK